MQTMANRTVAVLAVVGLLAAGAGTAYALSEDANARAATLREECQAWREAGDREAFRDCVKDALGRRHARPHGRPPFTYENGTVDGRWVTFEVADDGAIEDYAVKGGFATTVLFDRVALDADTEDAVRGPVYVAKGDGVGLLAFNAPNAALVAGSRTEETTLVLDVADDLAIEETDRGVRILGDDEHAARLVLKGNATADVDGDTITVTLPRGSGVAFAIEGYPRVAHAEKRALHAWAARSGDADAPLLRDATPRDMSRAG